MIFLRDDDVANQKLLIRLAWIFGITFAGFVLVVCGTITKNRFGANLDDVRCPQCNALQPNIRKATSWRQGLWGGWTCTVCGTEMDKWGRRLG